MPVQWGLWAAQSVQHPLKTAFCLPGRAAACAGVQRAAGAAQLHGQRAAGSTQRLGSCRLCNQQLCTNLHKQLFLPTSRTGESNF